MAELTPELLRERLDRFEERQSRARAPDQALYPCICGQQFVGQRAFTAHLHRTRKRARRHRLLAF